MRRAIITWVEVQHGVFGLLAQVLQADVLSCVAREREVGCHASDRRCCADFVFAKKRKDNRSK